MSFPSTITSTITATLDTNEKPTAAQAPGTTSQSTLNQFDKTVTLNAGSTPPGQVASYQTFLTTASGTIDLTALATLFKNSVDCTGLKLRAIQIVNLDPTNVFTIQAGAANPYPIGGNQIKVQPGGQMQMYFGDGLGAVAGGAKTLDWVGNAGTGNAKVVLILG
jgi:hypothetical protein